MMQRLRALWVRLLDWLSDTGNVSDEDIAIWDKAAP